MSTVSTEAKAKTETGLTLFEPGAENKTKVNKAGQTLVSFLTKKDYGVAHELKGAALTRSHQQYRIDRGVALNMRLSAAIASGQIVAEKVATTNDGFRVK